MDTQWVSVVAAVIGIILALIIGHNLRNKRR